MTRFAGRSGEEHLRIRKIVGPVGVYRRHIVQKWSPGKAHEVSVQHGIQIGHVRIGFSRNYLVWNPGTDEATREKRFW